MIAQNHQPSQTGDNKKWQTHLARIQVIRNARPNGQPALRGEEDNDSTAKIAAVPTRIIPKSIAGLGLLAHVLTGKFIDHMPFYRARKYSYKPFLGTGFRCVFPDWV